MLKRHTALVEEEHQVLQSALKNCPQTGDQRRGHQADKNEPEEQSARPPCPNNRPQAPPQAPPQAWEYGAAKSAQKNQPRPQQHLQQVTLHQFT